MVNNNIILNFEIEKGDSIGQCYFSARIKLTDESKNYLHEKFDESIQFNNLDNYFILNHEIFYIYYNKYKGHNGRNELSVKDKDDNYFATNLSLDYYGFSIELSLDYPIKYGFYPLYILYNPGCSNKEEAKIFDDYNQLLPIALSILENLLSNENNFSVKDMLLKLQDKVFEKKNELLTRKKQTEEEQNNKAKELETLIEEGKVLLFKVMKSMDIDDNRSAVALKLSEKGREIGENITLNSQKFYIAKYKSDEFLHYLGPDYDTLFKCHNLFFLFNKDNNLKSEFIWL